MTQYSYAYAQAAPCGALVGYKQDGDTLTLITTVRAPHIGVGRSLTAGGFWEVKDMLPQAAETMQDGDAELYREMYEELGEDIKTILPYADFKNRVEYVWDGMVRKSGNVVNAVVQKSIRLSDAEFDAIMKLPATDEQHGIKAEIFLTRHYNDAATAEADIRTRLSDFKYPEEVDAVVRWYNKKNAEAVKVFGP